MQLQNLYETQKGFASINPTNPRTNPWNCGNCSAFGHVEKLSFFWVGHFEFSFSKEKYSFEEKKKIKVADFSKWPFFKITNSQNFFAKISHIGPWVSRIDWCKAHQCSSTYMVVRLSGIRAKTGKKCIFCDLKVWNEL